MIRLTDPAARHGRKSTSQTITGSRTHASGTLESQFVTGILVTSANVHDSEPTPALLRQAESHGLKPRKALGDGACGTGANLRARNEIGVKILTKLSAPSHKCLTKRDFEVDLAQSRVTCPQGVTTSKVSMVRDPAGSDEPVAGFHFAGGACRACPLRETCSTCTAKGSPRTIILNRYEEEIQEAQRFNAKPESKALLRKRSAVERLLSHLVRMGMGQARFLGLHMAQFQAYMTAAVYNLQRYLTLTSTAA